MALALHLLTFPASFWIYWCYPPAEPAVCSVRSRGFVKWKGLHCKNEEQHVEQSEGIVGVQLSKGAGLCTAVREEALRKDRVGDTQQMQQWFLTF